MRILKMIQEFIGENKVYGAAVNGIQKDFSECSNPDEKPKHDDVDSSGKTKNAAGVNN